MEEREAYQYYVQRMQALLEEDYGSIEHALQGDFLEGYRELIRKELEMLKHTRQI